MGRNGHNTHSKLGLTDADLAKVKSGEEESELNGIGQGSWGRAAKDAADRIVKWIARREPPHGK